MNETFILLSHTTFINENTTDCHEIILNTWLFNECTCANECKS